MVPSTRPDDDAPPEFIVAVRAMAAAGLLVLVPVWVLVAFQPPERCTTSSGSVTTTSVPAAAPTLGGAASPQQSTTITASPAGPPGPGGTGAPQSARSCQPVGLTDPPLSVLGLVILLLAMPVLGLSEVGFAGLTVKRSAAKAEAAAKEATTAAQQVASAAASVAAARASSAATGNIVMVGGSADEPVAIDAGMALAFAANGVVGFLLAHDGVVDASVLWLDPATSSLRPANNDITPGADISGDLGTCVRRSITRVLTVDNGQALGLATNDASRVLAIPARQPPDPAVGVVLVVLTDAADARTIADDAAKAIRAVVLHIAAFTTAGAMGDDRRSSSW